MDKDVTDLISQVAELLIEKLKPQRRQGFPSSKRALANVTSRTEPSQLPTPLLLLLS